MIVLVSNTLYLALSPYVVLVMFDHHVVRLTLYPSKASKGVDVIAVVAANDLFVMSGWARFQGCEDKILALSDVGAKWSGGMNLSIDLTDRGLGVRTARYAMIIDDLVVKYVEVEPAPGVTVSGAEAVLAKL